jgi:hypothetical protein
MAGGTGGVIGTGAVPGATPGGAGGAGWAAAMVVAMASAAIAPPIKSVFILVPPPDD